MLHLFNHALMKGALFLAVGCIVLRIGDTTIHGIRGIGRQMPWTMAAFVAGGLSLIGIPFTVGFISKWYLVAAAIADGRWWIAAIILGSSLLAVIYVRSEEHTSELQSLMRISYAVFCLKKKKNHEQPDSVLIIVIMI